MKLQRAFFVLLASELVACSTTRVGINYRPPAEMAAAPSSQADVVVGRFSDDRGELARRHPRGLWQPAQEGRERRARERSGRSGLRRRLKARGLSADPSSARYVLSGSIKQLDCNQLARKEANAEIQVAVSESKGGKQVFANEYRASNVEGSVLTLSAGIFGSVEELRALMEKTLQQAVDQALDDPALRSAVHPESP